MEAVMERPRCPVCGSKMERQWLGDVQVWVCPDCGLPQ
jgi:ribosomal protein L37AE/L43A